MNQNRAYGRTALSNLLNGWRLLGVVATALTLATLFILATVSGMDGVRLIIRITARSSFTLFVLAFSASALVSLFPGTLTRWLRVNRRYLGLSFAVSHGIHGAAILALAIADPALFARLTNTATIVSGGIAYGFIAAMALTSFDRTAALIGRRAWVTLHAAGGWYLWVSFMFSFGKRAVHSGFHQPFIAVLIAVVILKIAAWSAKRFAGKRARTAEMP